MKYIPFEDGHRLSMRALEPKEEITLPTVVLTFAISGLAGLVIGVAAAL